MPTVQLINTSGVTRAALRLLLVLLVASSVQDSRAAERAAPHPGLLADFRKLADMRPRPCTAWEAPLAPSATWRLLSQHCAWQGRLRLHRLVAAGGSTGSCVSAPSHWWAFARRSFGAPGPAAPVWYASWPSQSISGRVQDVHKLAVIVRAPDGSWVVSEWNWKPSPRLATRRWQQGRWDLLLAEAARLAQPAPGPANGAGSLRAAWEASLGARPGEIVHDQWRWAAGGHCLVSDMVGTGDVKLHLPYLTEDSRLEQRAAMQLQLARRYPNAEWIKPFSLTDASATAGMGGARYKAVWREQSAMRGQLWIPTKGDGPVLRVRVTAGLPPVSPSQAHPAAAAVTAARAVDQELENLARAWGSLHD